MKIITAGSKFIDIDAYACCIAYAEFWQKQGVAAEAVCTAPLNESVSPIVRQWPTPLMRAYTPGGHDTFTILDVSEPEYFERFVDLDRMDEVIDHHPGLEDFWHQRIGDRAQIELVGAACTLVFERWERAGLLSEMSQTSARLLMCGILDNTLNFGAVITSQRDRHAYRVLASESGLPDDWPAQYFTDCSRAVLSDVATAVQNDSKTIQFKTFPSELAVGQLAVWDASELIQMSQKIFHDTLSRMRPQWVMNVISICENKSYFVSNVAEVKAWVSDLLAIEFNGTVAEARRMWLRKEIMAADLDRANKQK